MKQHQGYILLPVVLLISIVAAAAFMLNNESVLETNVTNAGIETARVKYVAGAGMQHALWQVAQAGCGPYTDISDEAFGADSYSASVTPNNTGGTLTTYKVPVIDDSYIKEDATTQTNGSASVQEVYNKWFVSEERRALYRFDIENAGIPAGANIVSAVAKIFVIKSDPFLPVKVHQVTADWVEDTVTWGNIASDYAPSPIATIPAGLPDDQVVNLNITSLVQGWVNGSTANQGITLKPSILSNGVVSEYSSKEDGTASQRPYLEIKVVEGSLSNRADISATGTLASGLSHRLERSAVTLYQSAPSSWTLQPGAEGKDSFIEGNKPDDNNGDDKNLLTTSVTGKENRALLQFNLNAIPPGARIDSAVLELYLHDNKGVEDVVQAYALSRDWLEDAVTWSSYDGINDWSSAGGDYNREMIGAFATSGIGWHSLDISEQAQSWVSGQAPNYGLVLLSPLALGDNQKKYYSSDENDETLRPRLTLSFSCICGITCQVPRGLGNVLLVVGNDTVLDAVDIKKKSLFESWGYTVKLLDDNANQAAFDARMNNNDVAYISETVSGLTLGSKLTDTHKGVVNEESGQNIELGLSDGGAQLVVDSLDIIDNAHYITAVFPASTIPLSLAPMEGMFITGTPASGLQTLAELSGSASMALVDSGAALGGNRTGDNATGRRVNVPVGRSDKFNWNYFNNNGRLLVQRAIQWSTGNLSPLVSDTIILSTDSTDSTATLGGLNFDDIDLASYDAASDSASLFFEGALTTLSKDIDAMHLLGNGHILLSTKDDDTLGGLSFKDGDLVDYDPVTDTATLYFDESAFSDDENIISVYLKNDGNLILSTDSDATLGGLSFTDIDLVEYDPVNDTATLFFEGSTTTLSKDIDAVHLLADGHIVLSTKDDDTLGGLSFLDGDLVEYDLATGAAALYFDEGKFAADENIFSVHIGPGSGELTVPLCNADYTPDTIISQFDSDALSSGEITGITWLPEGTIFNGITLSAGGWLLADRGDKEFYLTDQAGTLLTSVATPTNGPEGIGYVKSGTWAGHLVYSYNKNPGKILFVDLNGVQQGSFSVAGISGKETSGVDFIGRTESGTYNDSIIFSDSKDKEIFVADQAGNILLTIPVGNAPFNADDIEDVVHLPGTDKFMFLDKVGQVYVGDFAGNLIRQYDSTVIGIGESFSIAINPDTCDHVFGDKSVKEIFYINYTGGGGGGGPPTPPSANVVFETFSDANLASNGKSMAITKPVATAEGDLLVAAIATDGKQGDAGIQPPAGWNLINHGNEKEKVTLGVWWKIAGAGEAASYTFTWPEDQEAYGMIMRFTGHDPVNPINISSSTGGKSSDPVSPAVVTTVPEAMIVRIGGFDDDDINVGVTGLAGYNSVTMDKSGTGNGSASAGAGYLVQPVAGDSGVLNFSQTKKEDYRAVTIGIAPTP